MHEQDEKIRTQTMKNKKWEREKFETIDEPKCNSSDCDKGKENLQFLVICHMEKRRMLFI